VAARDKEEKRAKIELVSRMIIIAKSRITMLAEQLNLDVRTDIWRDKDSGELNCKPHDLQLNVSLALKRFHVVRGRESQLNNSE
jgi:hypothetical protein